MGLHWRKLLFSFVGSYQLEVASGLRMWSCVHFLSQLWTPVRAATAGVSELMCIWGLLCLSGLVFLVSFISSDSSSHSTSSSSGSLEPWWRVLMETSHLGLSIPRCPAVGLHIPPTAGGSVSSDGWARCWCLSRAECQQSHFLTVFFQQRNSSWLSPRSLVLGHPRSAGDGCHLMEWVLSPTRHQLVIHTVLWHYCTSISCVPVTVILV